MQYHLKLISFRLPIVHFPFTPFTSYGEQCNHNIAKKMPQKKGKGKKICICEKHYTIITVHNTAAARITERDECGDQSRTTNCSQCISVPDWTILLI